MNFTEYIAGTIIALLLGYLALQGAIIEPLELLLEFTAEMIVNAGR